MSQYQSYPTGPGDQGGYGHGGPGRLGKPKSVDLAIKLIYAGVVLGLLSSIVQFFTIDSQIDEQVTSAAVSSDTVRTTIIVSIVVGLVISVGIALLFAYFLGKGANWARIVYTVLSVLGLLFGLFGLFSLPILPLLLSLIGFVLTIVVLVLLYRPDSNAFFASR